MANQAENGSWFDHVLDWYQKCNDEPDTHLFLKYEDMFDDTESAIKKIATFLEIPLTEETLVGTLKGCSLGEMKQKSSIGLNHLRQGGYGNWRSMFSVQTSELFDDVYKYKMSGKGLTFNFGSNSNGEMIIM